MPPSDEGGNNAIGFSSGRKSDSAQGIIAPPFIGTQARSFKDLMDGGASLLNFSPEIDKILK